MPVGGTSTWGGYIAILTMFLLLLVPVHHPSFLRLRLPPPAPVAVLTPFGVLSSSSSRVAFLPPFALGSLADG